MIKTKRGEIRSQRRRLRVKKKLKGTAERPRLAVFRSNKQIYAQLVNDELGKVLTGCSSLTTELKSQIKNGMKKVDIGKLVGQTLAQRAKEKGISQVVFDRSLYLYHGRVRRWPKEPEKED